VLPSHSDFVTLEASQYPFPTVMASGNEWVESVQRALRWNVRGAVQKGWEQSDDAQQEEEEWDIDIDPNPGGGMDSGIGQSEDGGTGTGSPARRQNSILMM
jgi:NAD+ kinase